MVVTTAGGKSLARGGTLALREKELAPILKEFRALSVNERKPTLEDPAEATPATRPIPDPPAGGLILRGYCTYLEEPEKGKIRRKKQMYYRENPDAWAAETQNDMLWLTRTEWMSLVPQDVQAGQTVEVSPTIRQRFFSTIGIDYMEGSVNALPTRESTLTIKIEEANEAQVRMSLTGYGQMGVPFPEHDKTKERSRGCEICVTGNLLLDRKSGSFTRFDVVGIGKAWGNKMNYIKRAIRIEEYPWIYGITCELVPTRKPVDLIPPYNLVHYGSGIPYFAKP
ncbi:MAG: hypothetical protein VCA34_15190 [Roseibacillus sp.]